MTFNVKFHSQVLRRASKFIYYRISNSIQTKTLHKIKQFKKEENKQQIVLRNVSKPVNNSHLKFRIMKSVTC